MLFQLPKHPPSYDTGGVWSERLPVPSRTTLTALTYLHVHTCVRTASLTPLFPWASTSQVYPGQQYLQGGQYAASTAQYAPGPGQPPGPASSYAGHRLPLQQGMAQSLSAPGPTGLHYKVGLAPMGQCWGWAECNSTQGAFRQLSQGILVSARIALR